MEEIMTYEKEFKDLVHVIRGQQVMLDSDLAKLYGTEVKKLIQQVKRNIKKFPDDFMFQLQEKEKLNLWSQNVTANISAMSRSNPYVFTEQGIYMVATILKNDIATQQSIYIMRSFREIKHFLADNRLLLSNFELSDIHKRLDKHDLDINKIMDNFIDETKIKEITFLEGQRFEANEAYIDIYKQAKHTIYVIDNYVDFDTLRLLKYKRDNVHTTIFTAYKGKHKLHKTEVDNFCKEYPSLCIKKARDFHDRYIILDYDTSDEIMYHCGHSSKDTGNKISTIHKMLDTEVMHPIIDDLLNNDDLLLE